MKVLKIAANLLRRFARDRTAAFVALVLPALLILLLGLLFGDYESRVGVVTLDEGPLATQLAESIRTAEGVEYVEYAGSDELLDAIAHSDRDVGIVIPAGYDAALADGTGATVEYLLASEDAGYGVQSLIDAQIAAQAARVNAAHFASTIGGSSFEEGLDAADAAVGSMGGVEVRVVGAGETELKVLGQFDAVTANMMLLFVFLVTLSAGAAELIKSRMLGVSRRMLSTPTSAAAIIGGETTGRFFVALLQGLTIMVIGAVAFSVDWGSWPATLAIVTLFALVGAGAGMLLGSLARNARVAENLGTFLALAMALLGGLMSAGTGSGGMPYIPHSWANQAFNEILVRGGGVADIATELGVLAVFAVCLIGLAAVVFQRSVTQGHV